MSEPACPLCHGTGWKITEREGLTGASRCECAAASRVREVESRANIPPLYQNASLENFAMPMDNPFAHSSLGVITRWVRTYAQEYPVTDKPGLLFLGEPGTGKTHLAVAALRMLLARGFEGLFFGYQNLLERIRAGYDAASNSADREAYQSALEAEILLLDDLGAHRVSDWVEDTVTSIITYRCNNKKALIATTNLPDPDAGGMLVERPAGGGVAYRTSLAERIGMRARSRLFEMCKIVKMPITDDYRMRIQRNR